MIAKVVTVNLHQPIYERLTAKQGDIASRYLLFHLLDGAKPFDLTNRSVRVYARKPDKTVIFNDLIINDRTKGYCTLELTSQCLASAGVVKMELYISESGKVLTSIPFKLEVIPCINTVDSVTSTNEFSALNTALGSLQDYDNLKREIVEARKTYGKVGARLNDFDSQLDTIVQEVETPIQNEDSKIIRFNHIGSSGSSSTLFDSSKAFDGVLAIDNTNGNGWINKTTDRWIKFALPIGVVIGDSIAEGHKGTHGRLHLADGSVDLSKTNESGQLSFHLELLTGLKFINHGIGGQRTDEILARFDRDVLAKTTSLTPAKTLDYKPNLVVINAGVNDVLQNKSYESIVANLKSMMDICVENKIYAIFNTIGYFNSITPTQIQIDTIDEVNNWLKLQCDKSKYIKYWDYNKFISSEIHGFPNESLLGDKIHPKKETYRQMAEQIYYTHLRNNNINFIPNYITISTQINPDGLFNGLSRPMQIIVNYDNSNYSNVYLLDNKPIVNIPIPKDVSKPINEVKLTISTGQSPLEVSGLTSPSSNFYISEIYGTSSLTQENIIAKGNGYLVSTVPSGLASGRVMISDSDYSRTDNLKLYGVTTGDTTVNKVLVMSGTCIIEASETLSPNDFVITTSSGKIKKCTDFATQNIVARVVKNAGTSNALEYICEIIR